MVSLEEAFVSLGLDLEKVAGEDSNERNQDQIPSTFFRGIINPKGWSL